MISFLCQFSYGMEAPSSRFFSEQTMGIEEVENGFFWIRKFEQNSGLSSCDEAERETLFCDAPLRDNGTVAYWDGITRPDDYDDFPDKYSVYGEENKTLRIGYGGQKGIYKLNHQSDRVIFMGMADHITIKEYQAIVILNAFGFVSQQSPKIVDVIFKNGNSKKNVISALSFDHLVFNTSLKTWDVAHSFGFGNIPIFNGRDNFYSITYNMNLFSPLIKDLAALLCLGRGGYSGDSLNLIFNHDSRTQQTQCRLFLYDLYSKGASENDMLFKSEIKDFTCSMESPMKTLHKEVCLAMSQEERQLQWNRRCGDTYSINGTEVADQYNILFPHFLEEFDRELSRLIPIFQQVILRSNR